MILCIFYRKTMMQAVNFYPKNFTDKFTDVKISAII